MEPCYVLHVRPDGTGRCVVERIPVHPNRETGEYELVAAMPKPVGPTEIQHIEHYLHSRADIRTLQSIFLEIHPRPDLFYEWFSLHLWMGEDGGGDVGLFEELLQMNDPPSIEQLRTIAIKWRRRAQRQQPPR